MTAELALFVAEAAPPAAVDLVRRAAQGDAGAFDELVLRHHGELVRLARVVLASDLDAEDLAQECWARAWLRLRDLRDPARLMPWLRRILVRDAVRVAKRRGAGAVALAPELVATLAASVPPAALRIDVETALRALSPRQRAVFLLTEVDGCDAVETAARLGLAAATVRVHRLIARRKLRALFAGRPR